MSGQSLAGEEDKRTFAQKAIVFLCCFFGLQVSYLVWGMMQEYIMDTQYKPTPLTPSGKFPSATFCVFSNRFLAIIVSAIVCYWKHGSLSSQAPLLSFTPCALSNTISSWGQYQALSFVSFSLQTIFKSTKIIPVMIMGYLLKGTKYSLWEYSEAIMITTGVLIFSLSKSNWASQGAEREVIGFFLLCLYVVSDSFTSQWQSKIYKDHGKIDNFQMMFGVNVSAIVITVMALVLSGELVLVYEFFTYNPQALWYNVVTAITSTTGQFAIFYTIKEFGPVVFTIIMTTRQMLSIVVSNYLFGHQMTSSMYLGAFIVFAVLLYSAYRQLEAERAKEAEKSPKSSGSSKGVELRSSSREEGRGDEKA